MRRAHWGFGLAGLTCVALTTHDVVGQAPAGSMGASSTGRFDSSAMLQQARKVVADAQGALAQVKQQLTQAREAHDVIRAMCLADNLRQLQTAARSSGDRLAGLQSALTASQIERAQHEHAVLLALGERTTAIAGEAGECIGVEANTEAEGSLALQISPNVPAVDPSSSVLRPFGGELSVAALGPDSISPPPIVATPID